MNLRIQFLVFMRIVFLSARGVEGRCVGAEGRGEVDGGREREWKLADWFMYTKLARNGCYQMAKLARQYAGIEWRKVGRTAGEELAVGGEGDFV